MLKRARELELEPMAVAETYTTRHFQAMDRMGVIRPDICPRATGHIPEQLEAIEKMIEAGLAYEVNGSVYFDVSKDPEYGKLSNRSFEEMQEGARVEVRQEKRNPQDPLEKGRGRTPHALAGFLLRMGVSRLAHRMRGDEHPLPGRFFRHPRRGDGTQVSPP